MFDIADKENNNSIFYPLSNERQKRPAYDLVLYLP
jgi:hypothetical protein